jgi:hypothetical protein
MVDVQGLTTDREAVQLSASHPRTNALLDKVRFEFRDAADDREEQPTHGTISGDVFPSRLELNAKAVKLIDNTEEVLCAPGKPVEGGDDDNAELPLPRIAKHRIESGTPCLGATDADIGVLRDNLIPALLCEQTKVIQLVINPLV